MSTFEASSLEERDRRAQDDLRRLNSLCLIAKNLETEFEARRDLWEREEDHPLSAVDRTTALRLFDRSFDLQVAAHTITNFHRGVLEHDPEQDPVRHAVHFGLAHRAYFRRLTIGLDLCTRAQNRPQFETLFDEGAPRLGLRPGLWARFKWNVLHIEHVTRTVAAREHHKELKQLLQQKEHRLPDHLVVLLEDLESDWEQLERRLYQEAPSLLFGNVLDLLRDAGHALLLPVQTKVAGWLGDTRIYREGAALISAEQREAAVRKLRPGDVLFERRNWYLSNIGLPGFWPHCALWLGTPEELSALFDPDEGIAELYGKPFTQHLRTQYPEAWESFCSPDEENHERQIIEAVSEGVVFSSPEHSLHADYAAALRPRRSLYDIAQSIELAFSYWGRPYDFDFDFYSDQSLVCSELVYKSWEPRPGMNGIEFSLQSRYGRMNLVPNDIIAQWDEQADTEDSPFDFVWFLDGRETSENAAWADEETLRRSHERAKWDFSQE